MMLTGLGSTIRRSVEAVPAAGRALTNLDQNIFIRAVPGSGPVGKLSRRAQVWHSDDLLLETPTAAAPHTRFNNRISRRRAFCMVTLPTGQVKQLKNAYDATFNDVLVAICAGALRDWLHSTGDLPVEPLIAAIPVSIRAQGSGGGFGNEVGAMPVELPTDESDPVARITRCRDSLRGAKERHHAVPASLMRDSTDLLPPMLFGRATRMITRMAADPAMNPVANLVISNVPGPRAPMYCAGSRVLAIYPVSTLADSLGLNITIFSYLDQLNIGLLADPKLVPNLDALGEAIRAELDVLVKQTETLED